MDTVEVSGVRPGHAASAAAPESSHSAVSWAAIIAGAFVAVAVTIVLTSLGTGIGLTSISPWHGYGASATALGIGTIVGLIVVQWIASGIGGYITGRLRTKWVGVHTHEVFFRDTAHGFLTWTVATVVGAILLASATSTTVGGALKAAGNATSGIAQAAGQVAGQAASQTAGGVGSAVSAYDVDTLFRSDHPDQSGTRQTTDAEASRILAEGATTGDVPAGDRTYLAQMVASRTGISQADAQKRVDGVIAREKAAVAKAKAEAEAARKAASQFAIFLALSMVIGAFIASAAAAYGGSLRDEH